MNFIEIDFGDGNDTFNGTSEDTTVILEPQVSQAQTFIEINFDDANLGDMNNTTSVVGPQPLPSKFITIDFDAIETTTIEPTAQGAQIEVETKQFIEIDFGSENEENNVNANVRQTETPTFIELDFGDGDLVQTETPKENIKIEESTPQANGPRPTNTVLFFVPGTKRGILIYNQSPTGPEAKMNGYLPEGTFHASGIEPVDFDPTKHSEEFDYIRTPNGSYVQQVVMVDEKTMMKIVLQGIYTKSPEAEHRRHYFVVNIRDEERNLRKELIRATYEEEDLPPKQKDLLDVIKEVGRTPQGKHTIGDIIAGAA